MKHTYVLPILLIVLFIAGAKQTAAQCPVSLLANPSGGALPTMLTVTTGNMVAQRIAWYRDGILLKTEEAGWNPDGITVAGGNGSGTGLDQFNTPNYVQLIDDTMYIADASNHRIVKWILGETAGTVVAGITGSSGNTNDKFNVPFGLHADGKGNIYVADYNNHRIQKWEYGATSGTTVAGQTGLSGNAADRFHLPTHVYVKDDTLYVADYGAQTRRIQKWAPGATSGTTVAFPNTYQPRIVMFYDDSMYLSAATGHCIIKYPPGSDQATPGITVAGIPLNSGTGLERLNTPGGFALDKSKNLYITDIANNRIVKWAQGATTGTLLLGTGTAGSTANTLNSPRNNWLTDKGRMYVSDAANQRIQCFEPVITDTIHAHEYGIYKVVVTGFNGCKDSAMLSVAQIPCIATITNTGAAAFCTGDRTVLKANTGAGFNYQWKNGNTTLTPTDDSLVVTTSGNYTVTISHGASCQITSAAESITVHSLPNATIIPSGNIELCQGESLQLKAPAGSNMQYQWQLNSNPVAHQDSIYTITTGGVYTVTVTDNITQCSNNAAQVTVTLKPRPTAVIQPTGAVSFCQNSHIMLEAPQSGSLNRTWLTNGTANGHTGSGLKVETAGNYQIVVTNNDQCSDTSGITTVSVDTLPVVSITPSGSIYLCAGDTAILTASGSGLSYQWLNQNTPNGQGQTFKAAISGYYRVIATDGNNCSDTSSTGMLVTALPFPAVHIDPADTALCEGNSVLLRGVSADTGLTYQWLEGGMPVNGVTTSFYQVSTTGNFRVIVSRAVIPGCRDTSDITNVTVHTLPAPKISWDGTTLNTGTRYAGYQWFFEGQAIDNATEASYIPSENGTYNVTVTDSNGCTGSSTAYQTRNVGLPVTGMAEAVRIFPNPATGIAQMAASVPVIITINNQEGRTVLHRNNVTDLSINNLTPGLYLIRIMTPQGILMKQEKLIILSQ